ncbi:MAG: NrfD/PsrC family molybdoenzyme membrane anchor subunit [Syntrophothermus sp.]
MNGNAQTDQIINDLTRHVRLNKGFLLWMTFLGAGLLVCLYAYTRQLRYGLGVAGIRDFVSWGLYLSNFVFFVATSLIGMLISAVLGLIGYKWAIHLSRIAEIIAVGFSAVAGLVIIMDMGRPERLTYVFIHARVQSPILWDVTVVTTYFVLCLLLWYLPLIPDLALAHTRMQGSPSWIRKIYKILSLNWTDKPEQNNILRRCVRILLFLTIPSALAIHTVTSWLFAVTHRPGWNSTIFGPYFVTGAFVAGTAAVIIAMYVYRKSYKLEKYLTDLQFDNMAKLLGLVLLVYLYFNINEYMVPGYKMERAEAYHIHSLFSGDHALMFWSVMTGGLLLPIILVFFKPMRKPLPLMWISVAVFVGSWFKRYIIVIPTQEHPFLPVQHYPREFMVYTPTLTEIGVTLFSFFLTLIIITILSKFFPIIPIKEAALETAVESEPREKL